MGTLVIVYCELVSSFFNAVFENPLVRRNCESNRELATVFWLGSILAVLSILLIALVYFFIDDVSVVFLLIFSCISAISSVMARPFIAVLRCKRQFKALAIRTIWGKLLGAICGITAAIYGLGAWSLIIQLNVMNLLALIILLLRNSNLIAVRPSFEDLFSLFREGNSIGLRKLQNGLFGRGLVIILSIATSAATIGYYSFARRLIDLPKQSIVSSVNSYSLPVFSSRTKDSKVISNLFSELTICSIILLFPIFVLMGIFGKELVIFVFGEKWLGAVDFLMIYAFISGIHVLTYFTDSLLAAYGQSKIGLKLEFLKSIILLIIAYYISSIYGLLGVALIILLDVVFTIVIRILSVKKLIVLNSWIIFTTVLKVIIPVSIIGGIVTYCLFIYDFSIFQIFIIGFGTVMIMFSVLFVTSGNYISRLQRLITDRH